ncbi:Putative DNA-binding ESCAROLA -like protein [Gossypium arboreum]|uniref:AT-hook motif nuclear-localized protein n=1 Tax=Gossypium arboreum TaxID=29729 RepID=A0A0B0NSQ1_GOSAR|nr:Putative DNA-binding ESCAROLA -like protein [Gossypium arboreum]
MEEKESTISGSLGNSDTDSPPAAVSSLVMNMSLDGATAIVPVAGAGGDSLGKKKRGRPRKYDADGKLRIPFPYPSSTPAFTLSPSDFSSSKRGKGMPSLGELFVSTAGGDFTPHVVTVNTGEDVAGKILSFSRNGPRGICILSANGAVSNVTIRQPVSDTSGGKSRTGGLSVSLAGPDGRVIGGGLAGILVAASPIQIVVGSFMPNGYKVQKRKHYRQQTAAASTVVAAAPPSATAATKADGENCMTSAYSFPGERQSLGEADNNNTIIDKHLANPVAASIVAGWNGSDPSPIHRPSPDINVSVSSE